MARQFQASQAEGARAAINNKASSNFRGIGTYGFIGYGRPILHPACKRLGTRNKDAHQDVHPWNAFVTPCYLVTAPRWYFDQWRFHTLTFEEFWSWYGFNNSCDAGSSAGRVDYL